MLPDFMPDRKHERRFCLLCFHSFGFDSYCQLQWRVSIEKTPFVSVWSKYQAIWTSCCWNWNETNKFEFVPTFSSNIGHIFTYNLMLRNSLLNLLKDFWEMVRYYRILIFMKIVFVFVDYLVHIFESILLYTDFTFLNRH